MPTLHHDIRSHIGHLLRLGLPLVGSSVASFAIHMTDTVMLGWYSVTSLAAATVAASIFFILFILGAGFAMALLSLVASASDEVRARRVTRMTLWLSLLFSVLILPVFWWSGHLFLLLGQEPEIAAEAERYLRIMGFAMVPALLAMSMRSFLSAKDFTQVQLWVTVAGIFANAGLNYLLIFGNFGFPEMGIRGAAVASIIIDTAILVALAAYAHHKMPHFHLFQRIWRPDWQAFFEVARMGMPIGLTSLAEGGLFTASALMMGWIGEVQLAGHGIALQLTALTFMFHVGMSQAATVLAGRAYGQRNEAELRRIAYAALIVAASFGVLVIAVFLSIPEFLVRLFLDPNEPLLAELVAAGAVMVMVSTAFQFADSSQIIALSLLRGVHDTTVPMWLATVSYWVIGLPVTYVFGFVFGWGAVGIWLGLTVGLAAASILLMLRFWGHAVRLETPAAA